LRHPLLVHAERRVDDVLLLVDQLGKVRERLGRNVRMTNMHVESALFINLGPALLYGPYHFLEFGYVVIAEDRADHLRPEIGGHAGKRGIGNDAPYAVQPIPHFPSVIRPATCVSDLAPHYTLNGPGHRASLSLNGLKFESYLDLLQLQMVLPPLGFRTEHLFCSHPMNASTGGRKSS
jgi:hypothetical protein